MSWRLVLALILIWLTLPVWKGVAEVLLTWRKDVLAGLFLGWLFLLELQRCANIFGV